MEQRTLGRSGLRVSRIGFGLAAVGRPAYITVGRDTDLGSERGIDVLRLRAHELLDAAVSAGITYVDVARSYGLAESFVGSWLGGRPAGKPVPVIGSKWGYTYVGDWRMDAPVHEVKDHSLAAFRRQLAESRAVLGDRLRLYQVHSATLESGILEDPAVLGALADLGEAGTAVGLSVSGPRQADVIRRALDVRVDGRNPFSTVQATWNVLEQSAGAALEEAHEAGFGVLVKEVLANGRLVAASDCPPTVAAIAARHVVGPDAVAIAAALTQPWADVVLSGAVTVAQLDANLAGLGVRLSAEELAELVSLAESSAAYWEARGRLAWT